jgi:hypothetical protein
LLASHHLVRLQYGDLCQNRKGLTICRLVVCSSRLTQKEQHCAGSYGSPLTVLLSLNYLDACLQ